jgi:two-component system sporulation sensor kinase A
MKPEQENVIINRLNSIIHSWSRIRSRIALYFLLAGSSILVLGLLLTNMFGTQTVRKTIGSNFQELANVAANRIEATMKAEHRHLEDLARNPLTVSALAMAKTFYTHTSKRWIEHLIKTRDSAWQEGFTAIDTEVLESDLAEYLASIVGFRKDVIVGISIIDMQGALLAASSRPLHFDMRSMPWWKSVITNNNSLYVSGILDHGSVFPATDSVVELVIPIQKNKKAIGTIYMAIKSKVLSDIFDEIHVGESGHVMLVSELGMPLVCKFMAPGAHQLNHELTKKIISSKPGWGVVKDDGHGGTGSIVGFAPVRLAERLGVVLKNGPQWYTYVRQDPRETYAGVGVLLQQVGWLGTLLVIMLGLIGLYAGKRIETPILALQKGARLFGTGDLNQRIQINSHDEIGELAKEFNQMADNILNTQEELTHFADAVIHAGDAIIMTDLGANIFYVNPSFAALTGYSAEEAIGRTPSLWKSGETSANIYKGMWASVLAGHAWSGEIVNKKKNGEKYVAQMVISPIRNKDGVIVSLLGVQRDVTEQLAMQEELRRHHDELELLVEERAQEIKQAKDELEGILKSANDVIITLDADGKFKYLNERINMWGYLASDLIGRPFNAILAAQVDDCPQNCGSKCQLLGEDDYDWLHDSKIREFCIMTQDCELRNVMVSSSNLEGGDTLVIARDMTEVKTLQRNVARSEKLRLIGEMATMVAHDFRNPLSTIKMNLQILSRKSGVGNSEREHFDLALDEVGTLEHLLSSMLDYARPGQLKLQQYDLHETLENVLQRIRFMLDQSQVSLELDFQSASSIVECDSEKIEHVWRNIIMNAVQAMPDGGILTVSSENVWIQNEPEVLIRISDTGHGMSDNVQERLFDPFFSMRSGGTGLGLAIVKKIIEAHQGSIEVVSEVSKGTEFLIALPVNIVTESNTALERVG